MHPRRLLQNLAYTHTAHFCVNRAKDSTDTNIDLVKLSKLLNPNPKSSLPHPLWRPIHDAILVTALAKHGWIDRDKVFHGIINDDEIKWGTPFDNFSIEEETVRKRSIRVDKCLRGVADRVVKFLNNEKESIKEFKGFNLHLILETYCIRNTRKGGDKMGYKWEVDYGKLKKVQQSYENQNNNEAANAKFQPIELPPRKDLLRRAKLLLSKPLSSYKLVDKKVSVSSHHFGPLDQNNICNIFLAEILRESIKLSQKRQTWIERLLTIAHGEAEFRSNEYLEGSKDSNELLKISKHILLAKNNCKPFTRAAKNVIRAILGIEVHQPKKPNEVLFVDDKKHPQKKIATPETQTKNGAASGNPITPVKHKKTRGIQTTAGDAAVNTALFIGKQNKRNESIPNISYLKLTAIETLILSVLCSQGIPVWQENWHESLGLECTQTESYQLTWNEIANVLEGAAEAWHGMASRNIENLKGTEEVSHQLISELENRRLVLSEAKVLQNEPVKLARKVIMLLEALRIHGASTLRGGHKKEFILGSKVLTWCANDMVKWAQCLGVFIAGKVASQYAVGLRPDIIPSAFISEKGCLDIFSQISQQTRLRSIYLKYSEEEFMNKMLPKAVKRCDSYKNEWADRPSWWSTKHKDDERLVSGILTYGYGGFDVMINKDNRFSSTKVKNHSYFDRFTAQVRLDTVTRELSSIDDRAESMKLINERSRMDIELKSKSLNRQIGIDSFFSRRNGSKKNENVEKCER